MTIAEDAELRALFEVEALDRLTRLGELLLRLEADGACDELIASLFREAHTLKGSADMVGLATLAAEADALETVLDDLRAGTRTVDAELVDGLFVGLDRLSALSGIPVATRSAVVAAAPAPGAAPAVIVAPNLVPPTAPPAPDRAPVLPVEPLGHDATSAGRETARVRVDRLDELVRLAGEAAAAHQRTTELLRSKLGADTDAVEVRTLTRHLTDLQDQTLRARMLPIGQLLPALRRSVRDVARRTGRLVALEVEGEGTEVDRDVHLALAESLVHLVRNAVDHGVEPPTVRAAAGKPEEATVRVRAAQVGTRVEVTVIDDGRGVDLDAVRARAATLGIDLGGFDTDGLHELLFRPGFSTAVTSDVSGRGVGLDAVRDAVTRLRGRVECTSEPGLGSTIRISVPTSLTVLPSVVLGVGSLRCAVALHGISTVLDTGAELQRADGRTAVRVADDLVPMAPLGKLLDQTPAATGPIVVVKAGSRSRALRVDAVLDQRDVVVKALPEIAQGSELVVGAAAEPDGSVLLVLDIEAVMTAVDVTSTDPLPVVAPTPAEPSVAPMAAPVVAVGPGRLLVVDDALTVRELQRTILERAGYLVRTAADGAEALQLLEAGPADLVLSDIEMPGIDGLDLTRAIRVDSRWRNLPVVLLTSRGRDEDRERGLEAGADAYIVKSSFDERALLDVVEGLLGAVQP